MSTPAVDMHCHLDLYPDPRAEVEALLRQKAYVLSVTTTPKAWRQTAALAAGQPRIKTALGLHPQLAKDRKGELDMFDALLPETRYVGEVGLDGSRECRSSWREQVYVFEHVLRSCARAGGRILSLHSRSAAGEVLDALEHHPGYGVAILHWFSGTQRELARAVEMGCWFSVGGAMLRGQKGRELADRMPRDRVVTETDGPFAAVNQRVLQPAECALAIEVLANLWDMTGNEAKVQVISSFRTLIS